MTKLAIDGGERSIPDNQEDALQWPIITEEEVEAVAALVRKGDISVSDEPRKFENEFSSFIGRTYALAEVNGTAALHSAFHTLGVGEGDEVLCPSYTYWATVMPAAALGAKVIFCEIDPATLNVDPADIERRITDRTKAIVVVHLWGLPCDIDTIMEIGNRHNIPVVEDAAHAHGATYRDRMAGSFGSVSVFSFQASKNMPAGEGGMLLTDSQDLYHEAIAFGHYRETAALPPPLNRYQHTSKGFKYRMSPLHAAIGRIQLRHLDKRNEIRNNNIETLQAAVRQVPGFSIPRVDAHIKRVYYENNVLYDEDITGVPHDRVEEILRAEGALVRSDRYPLLHMQPYFVERGSDPEGLPVTQKTVSQVISLPTFPADDGKLVARYVEAFQKLSSFLSGRG